MTRTPDKFHVWHAAQAIQFLLNHAIKGMERDMTRYSVKVTSGAATRNAGKLEVEQHSHDGCADDEKRGANRQTDGHGNGNL